MDFIGSGNRILTENFTIGYLYTITFRAGYYINSACIGKGADNVMFQRTEPELLFSLNMDTAPDVYSIELYSGGGGTDDYETLSNKPQINNVTLTGDLSLSDLGIQPVINADNMLSYTLVSGLGTSATTDASDYATAAQGALAATSVQPADLNAYQTKIDNSSKLSADYVDDTTTNNKFATAAELSQIETNKNNISSLEKRACSYLPSSSKTILEISASNLVSGCRGNVLISVPFQNNNKIPSLIIANFTDSGFGTQSQFLTSTTNAAATAVTTQNNKLYITVASGSYAAPVILPLIAEVVMPTFSAQWLDSIPT